MRIPMTLIIMDGYGLSSRTAGNAIAAAATPVLDRLYNTCPNTTLSASGKDVGLPPGQPGNCEAGHVNIGAGRVVEQDHTKISRDIASGGFLENRACRAATAAYPPEIIENTLGQTVSNLGLRQLRAAETEKYAHVTYFFNGGAETAFKGEDRLHVPSPRQVPACDLIPEMSARELTQEVVRRIQSGIYDVIVLNYANCDMAGHTGVFAAAVKAVETVDECVGAVVDATAGMGGISVVTADHGNAEEMAEDDGVSVQTARGTHDVPFILVGADVGLRPGRLADIAPTILELMGIEKPAEMTGESLIIRR